MIEFLPYTLPPNMEIAPDEVHVWLVSLQIPSDDLHRLTTYLSPDEEKRVQKFHFEKDKRDYCACRGTLRVILGAYLKQNPASLSFSHNDLGKPFLSENTEANKLLFNLSHSRSMALYCLSRGRRVGIDLEYIHSEIVEGLLNEHVFSSRETTKLQALPEKEQIKAFFDCWTRKEAFSKALGKGISIPMNQFEVSFVPGEPPRLLHTEWSTEEPDLWEIVDLNIDRRYSAALAVEGRNLRLRCWEWSDSLSQG